MLQQQQAELTPFQVTTAAEAAPPISNRRPINPPPGGTTGAAGITTDPNFEELGPGDDTLDAGGISGGNRWPRQETLALLRIRSDMEAAFRDATLKGPLWDEVSRKLGELGYKRSSKKCKEKFENVRKYYKRTKEGRAGRQDGKSYRFFDQLEAFHNITMSQNPSPQAPPPPQISAPTPISTAAPAPPPPPPPPPPSSGPELSFSTNTSSSSEYDSDPVGDGMEGGGRKRKRKMMEFFEGMMRQVIERQEAMHQRFLEAIEKREQDRMIREEARQRQEMLRIAHEHELAAQERAAAASRDEAIISFLQKFTGQTVQIQASPPPPPPPPPTVSEKDQQQQQQQNEHQITPPPPLPRPQASSELVLREKSLEPHDPMSSRWPKLEVHALIQLRSGLHSRYQETGPKGPLWEEISAGMQRLGYNRSAKRCKEKWENINKYFKKVKESDKKRPEDAKTCPYFHQLDALYRSKHNHNGGGGSAISVLDQANSNLNPNPSPITMIAPSENQGEMMNKSGYGGNGDQNIAGGDNSGMIMKKPEDIMKELMGQSNNDYGEPDDSDNMDEYDEGDEEDDDEDGNGQYRIQFQKQNMSNNGSGSSSTPNNGSGKVSGSFLAMVR